MKILITSLAYHPFVGGAEVAVKEITDRLPDITFDMVTVNLDGKQPKIQRQGNVNVYRVNNGKIGKYFFPWTGYYQAQKLYRENKYDVVWAIMANQSGLIALKLKKNFPEVKYLLTLQEGDSLKRIWSRTWFMRRQYKNIYKKADKIQAISNFLAGRAKKYGYKKDLAIVPNGVDLKKFTREFPAEELTALKDKLGISATEKVIITTSRLVHKNGIDTLITAVKNLPVKVLILGSGLQESKLKALTQELEIKDKILFLGHINHDEMIKYLKISDIFIRPSRSEGLGVSFLEAMATGLPIIAPNVGGIPDFLKDQQTGLFCEVDNPADLVQKIKILLEDENKRQVIAVKGQELVLNHYSWDKIAVSMKEVFYNLKS